MVKWILFFFGVLFLISPVSAYLDSGVGSMVWQILVAVTLGVTFTLKVYWMKIKKFFKREKTDTNPED